MTRPDELLGAAQSAGLLPATAAWPRSDHRPWPVVVLTALGAWLAVLPLLAVVGFATAGLWREHGAMVVVGVLVMSASVVVVRQRHLPLFVEQLGLCMLFVGMLVFTFGFWKSWRDDVPWWVLSLLCLVLAWPVGRGWLRSLLGALAIVPLVFWLLVSPRQNPGDIIWIAAVAGLFLWAVATRLPSPAVVARVVEPFGQGWLIVVVALLALQSGDAWLIAGLVPNGLQGLGFTQALAIASVALAVAALALLAHAWPLLRTPRWAACGALLLPLAWALPSFGPLLVVLALCATQHRWRLAVWSLLGIAWVVSSLYYRLDWPLQTKAFVLIGLGLLLGVLQWASPSAPSKTPALAWQPGSEVAQLVRWGIPVALGLTLVLINGAIWQKEQLIRTGQVLLVPLGPVDPRSLMQGDYMTLDFGIRWVQLKEADRQALESHRGAERPRLVFRHDPSGVVQWLRLDRGTPLAADEGRIELKPSAGDWLLVTDAWYFKEGEAERWAKARFGEFRVTDSGKALLVGMRDANLQPIKPR